MGGYIKKEDAIEQIQAWCTDINHPTHLIREDAVYILEHMPSADVVEVVWCEDCARASEWQTLGICDVWKKRVRADFFCGFGVRKER